MIGAFLMIYVLNGKLPHDMGRSWRIQNAALAAGFLFMAIFTACGTLGLETLLYDSVIWFAFRFSLVMSVFCFVCTTFIVTVRVPGAVEALHVPRWAYRWLFDEHDARRPV
jgi:integral membrane sensor domain MASE1